jgi:hypothetical protein
MIGGDAIAFLAIGELDEGEIFYLPVSRVIAGGFSSGRSPAVAELGAVIIWDSEDLIIWDSGDSIVWLEE